MEISEFVNLGKLLLRADMVEDTMKLDMWIAELRTMPSDPERDGLLSYAEKKRFRNVGRLVSADDRRALVSLAQQWNAWGQRREQYFEFLQGNITLKHVADNKKFCQFHQNLLDWVGNDEPYALTWAVFRVMEAVQHHIPISKSTGKKFTEHTTIMTRW